MERPLHTALHPACGALESRLVGATVVIATQTRAELLIGWQRAHWGERPTEEALARLDATPTVPVNSAVVIAFVELTVAARDMGHALGEKLHTADRWIAATAIAIGAVLLSGDGTYHGAPGLRVLAP